jgi:hypothetical protein
VATFFDDCKDISNDQLQDLWGRLLALEVAQPDSCSRRTLAVLKALSPADADVFRVACGLAWTHDTGVFIPTVGHHGDPLLKFGLSYGDLLELNACGLLNDNTGIKISFAQPGGTLTHGSARYSFTLTAAEVMLGAVPFTRSGAELSKAVAFQRPPDWEEQALEYFKRHGILLSAAEGS